MVETNETERHPPVYPEMPSRYHFPAHGASLPDSPVRARTGATTNGLFARIAAFVGLAVRPARGHFDEQDELFARYFATGAISSSCTATTTLDQEPSMPIVDDATNEIATLAEARARTIEFR